MKNVAACKPFDNFAACLLLVLCANKWALINVFV